MVKKVILKVTMKNNKNLNMNIRMNILKFHNNQIKDKNKIVAIKGLFISFLIIINHQV